MDIQRIKEEIDLYIKANGNREITGPILNSVLKDMMDATDEGITEASNTLLAEVTALRDSVTDYLNKGYLFGGLVSPNTTFVAGVEKMAFLASEAGRYPAFGGYSLADGELAVFLWDGEIWTKQIISYYRADQVYGVRHYYNNASPDLTRIGDSSLHRDLPVQSGMRRCVVNSTGDVVYYLGANDSTKKADGTAARLDGTDGQVMVEVPAHYRKTSLNAEQGYMDTEISLFPFEGAILVPRYLVSAYEASLDRENNLLSSVVNTSARFRGGNNDAAWDGTYRSLLGLPATNINLANFRQYGRNRGNGWGCYDWNIHNDIFWLFAIEYATLNSQKTFNASLDPAGFHQGGLGSGVSHFSNWNTYNSLNPIIPCGFTNSLGNNTGIKEFTLTPEQAEHYGSEHSESVPSYRGIENPFGHLLKWTDGYLGIGNGEYQEVYISRNPSRYASSLNDSYVDMGHDANANGYVKSILATTQSLPQNLRVYGDLIGTDDAAGATSYYCDIHFTAHANGIIYGALCGGFANYGTNNGFVFISSGSMPAYTAMNIGSRLCWSKPL